MIDNIYYDIAVSDINLELYVQFRKQVDYHYEILNEVHIWNFSKSILAGHAILYGFSNKIFDSDFESFDNENRKILKKYDFTNQSLKYHYNNLNIKDRKYFDVYFKENGYPKHLKFDISQWKKVLKL